VETMPVIANADFAVFVACLVAGVFALDRVLSVVIQWRTLFSRPPEGGLRPVTQSELDSVKKDVRDVADGLHRIDMNLCQVLTKMGLRPVRGDDE
jgi:hypothetical protein